MTRRGLLDRYREGRARTESLFSRISPEAFFERPIPLRHPIVFYRGHLAAFDVNTLLRRALGREGVRADFETLFERGIDPLSAGDAARSARRGWPARAEIEEYVGAADRRIEAALGEAESLGPGSTAYQAARTIVEHQAMHQETLLYIFHRLPLREKSRPEGYAEETGGPPPRRRWLPIPPGTATLGAPPGAIPFGWDNEFGELSLAVPGFEIESDDVTNADYLEFVEAGGYENPAFWDPGDWEWIAAEGRRHPLFWERGAEGWVWRAMFRRVPLPAAWPVYVSLAEARAYARFRGARLPTEAEYHRAAFGTPEGGERPLPWGEAEPDASRGNFGFASWDPVPAGSRGAGASAFGVRDLAGNGWEWTESPFAPFPGFAPMALYPQYSVEFFDGRHFVMKGASPATDVLFLRRTFRNWFQARYPYVYATFRCARGGAGA